MCCNCLLWLLKRLSNFLSSFSFFSLPPLYNGGGRGMMLFLKEKKSKGILLLEVWERKIGRVWKSAKSVFEMKLDFVGKKVTGEME